MQRGGLSAGAAAPTGLHPRARVCRAWWWVLALGALTAPAGSRANDKDVPSIALLPLHGVAVPEAERTALERELRAALAARDLRVEAPTRTAEALEDVRALGLACDFGAVECLVRVGAIGLTNLVLSGTVSSVAGGYELELQLVDVVALQERARQRAPVPGEGQPRARGIDGALTAVLRPEAWRGALQVDVPGRMAASVLVDGTPQGLTPLRGSLALTPGRHELVVELDGFRSHRESVEVIYDELTRVTVALAPGLAPAAATPRLPKAGLPVDDRAYRGRLVRIAFHDVGVVGVPERLGRVLGSFIVAELRKRENISVLDGAELRALTRGCATDDCGAAAAQALGADGAVVVHLTQTEGQTVLGLRRVDKEHQRVVAGFAGSVPVDDHAALLELVGKSIDAVFPDAALRSGERAGVAAEALRVIDPPPLPPFVSGALAVLTGAGALVTTGLLAATMMSASDYEAALVRAHAGESADENAALAQSRARFEQLQPLLAVTSVCTAVLGGSALGTGLLTDWAGDAARGRSEE